VPRPPSCSLLIPPPSGASFLQPTVVTCCPLPVPFFLTIFPDLSLCQALYRVGYPLLLPGPRICTRDHTSFATFFTRLPHFLFCVRPVPSRYDPRTTPLFWYFPLVSLPFPFSAPPHDAISTGPPTQLNCCIPPPRLFSPRCFVFTLALSMCRTFQPPAFLLT